MRIHLCVILTLAACTSTQKDACDGDTGSADCTEDEAGSFGSSDDDDDDNIGDDGWDNSDDLPPIRGATQDPGDCEEVLGEEVAGAASRFYGEYYDDGSGTWSGQERFSIWANETWIAAGGEDCEVVWTAIAEEIAAPACAGCDIGLQTTLTLDLDQTTCDLEIVGGENGSASYGIARTSSGDSTWFFASSGERFGDGNHIEGAMNFLTDPSCRWW